MRLFSRLSGDDIFISYSRKDGSLYAAGLADELTEKKFSCFIDKLGVPPNHDLPPELIKKIKNCSIMVLVGTEMAAKSTFVQKEIQVFKETGRTILPIDFDGNVGNAVWYEDIPGLATETEKEPTALEKGDPSDNVIRFIEKSFNYTRRNRYMARMLWGAIGAFLILMTIGIGGFLFANNEANKEREKANVAISDAKNAQDDANTAKTEANTARSEANTARSEANTARSEANTARSDAVNANVRAAKANSIADDATKRAEEQTQKADLAEQRAKLETARAETQAKLAKTHLAESYYMAGQTESIADPIKAIPWMQKAIVTSPETNSRLDIYKLRALQLSRNIPHLLTDTKLVPKMAKFNSTLDRLFIVQIGPKPVMWDVVRGVSIPIPWETERDEVYIESAVFSRDNKWMAALYRDTSPEDKGQGECLKIWEVENIANSWKQCKLSYSEPDSAPDTLNWLHPFPISIEFSPDSRVLMVNCPKGNTREITLYDWVTKRPAVRLTSDIRPEDPALPRAVQVRDGTGYITDSGAKYRKDKESIRRGQIPVSRDPDRNWIISFKANAENTVAEVKDMTTGASIMPMPLDKIIDYIDFTGDARSVVTISHNNGGEKIYRSWDLMSRAKTYEGPLGWDYDILAVNRSGDKFVLRDNKRQEIFVSQPSGNGVSHMPIDMDARVLGDIEAAFLEDERYVVTRTFKPTNYVEFDWETNVWAVNPAKPDVFSQVRRPLMAEYADLSVLATPGMLGAVAKDGKVSLWNFFSRPDEQVFSLSTIPLEGSYDIYNSYIVRDSVVNVQRKSSLNMPPGDTSADRETKVEIRSLTDGKVQMSKIIEYMFISDLSSTTDTTRDGSRFLAIQSGKSAKEGESCQYKVSVRSFRDGSELEGFAPICGNMILHAVFNRGGDSIITYNHRTNDPGQVQQWSAVTGSGNASQSFEIDWKKMGTFTAFTRYGEFVITSPSQGYRFDNQFKVTSTNSLNRVSGHFRFSDRRSYDLAVSILKQGEEIKILDTDNVIAIMPSGLSVQLKYSDGNTSIINTKTQMKLIAPKDAEANFKLSADGRLLLGLTGRHEALVWESTTGLPITNILSVGDFDMIRFFDFTLDGKNVVTISASGQVRSWYIGSMNGFKPFWIDNLGESLSGGKLTNDAKVDYVTSAQSIRSREDLKKRLLLAPNDSDARFILNILAPKK